MNSSEMPPLQLPDSTDQCYQPDPAVIEVLAGLLVDQTLIAEAGRLSLRWAMTGKRPEEATTIEEVFATERVASRMRAFYEAMQGEYLLHPEQAVPLSDIAKQLDIAKGSTTYLYQRLAPHMDRLGIPRPLCKQDPEWKAQAREAIIGEYDRQQNELAELSQPAQVEKISRSLGFSRDQVRAVVRDIHRAKIHTERREVLDLREKERLGNKAITEKTELDPGTVARYLAYERTKQGDPAPLRLRSKRRTAEEIAVFEARVAAYRTNPESGTWTNAEIARALVAESGDILTLEEFRTLTIRVDNATHRLIQRGNILPKKPGPKGR